MSLSHLLPVLRAISLLYKSVHTRVSRVKRGVRSPLCCLCVAKRGLCNYRKKRNMKVWHTQRAALPRS